MIQWPCNDKTSRPIHEKTKQRVAHVVLYNRVTDLSRKRAFTVLNNEENIHKWGTCIFKKKGSINDVIISIVFTPKTDYHVVGLRVGGGVQRQGSVHACGWYTANMFNVVLCVTQYISVRQCAMFLLSGDQLSQGSPIYLTYVYLLRYFLIYLLLCVFNPFVIYACIPFCIFLCLFAYLILYFIIIWFVCFPRSFHYFTFH